MSTVEMFFYPEENNLTKYFTSSETALDAISADSGGKFFFREFSVRVLNTSKKWLRSSIREKSMFAPPFSCDSITDRRRGQERNLVRKEVPPSEEDHRSPENNFYLIAEFWYTYLSTKCVASGGHVQVRAGGRGCHSDLAQDCPGIWKPRTH
ncbi:MAG: hypothetical protein ACLUFK_04905 [Oscillospiraceae bacterium]